MKKAISVILTMALFFSGIPVIFPALAQAPQGQTEQVLYDGFIEPVVKKTTVPAGYVGIYTKQDLDQIRNNLAGKYILMNDIVFDDADFKSGGAFYNGGQGWMPIGTSTVAFTGIFDGNGYAVEKLYSDRESTPSVSIGLFSYSSGTIQNLKMLHSEIKECSGSGSGSGYYPYVGGITGKNSGIISNCYNTGMVSALVYAGGIAGSNESPGSITNCYNAGTVSISGSGTKKILGGIAGSNSGSITNCSNIGTVSDSAVSHTTVYAGGIAGSIDSNIGIITNCYNTGEVSAINSSVDFVYAGGVVGYINSGIRTISNCYNTGGVNSRGSAGGIVGSIYDGTSFITQCYNTGLVSGRGNVGGIAGIPSGPIANCYNIGKVSASGDQWGMAYAGGIAGQLYKGDAIINCYNTGEVNATGSQSLYAGGIVGRRGYSTITLTNCYNTGKVSANPSGSYTSAYTGGIGGETYGPTINCYYLNTSAPANSSGISLTEEAFRRPESFVGFDFDWIWRIFPESEYLYPVLRNTAEGPVALSSKFDLKKAGDYPYLCYILSNDIIFSAADFEENGDFYNGGNGWIPIGQDGQNPFYGVFDGNNYAVKGLYSNQTGVAGLFGCNRGTIKNLKVLDSRIKAYATISNSSTYAGGIAGWNYGTIDNCCNTGIVSGTVNITGSGSGYVDTGGIVGKNDQGTIINCYNTGTISGAVSASSSGSGYVGTGGIAGESVASTIINCYNTGTIHVSGSGLAGGIAGYNRSGTITDSYNTGDVNASLSGSAGGIAGENYYNSTISSCRNIGIVNISDSESGGGIAGRNSSYTVINNCHNTGAVNVLGSRSGSAYAGGIVGDNSSTITNCYSTGTINISGSQNAFAGGIAGQNRSDTAVIDSCYNAGKVSVSDSGYACAGGIAGNNYYLTPTITNCYNTGEISARVTGLDSRSAYAGSIAGRNLSSSAITNCYNAGKVSANASESDSHAYTGGIAGDSTLADTIKNCYYLKTCVSASTNSYGTTLTKEAFLEQESFAGFDFTDVWEMFTVPRLRGLVLPLITSLSFVEPQHQILCGEKFSPALTGAIEGGKWIADSWTTETRFAFSVINPAILSVDDTGTITGLSPGTTQLVVIEEYSGLVAHCTITVIVLAQGLAITGAASVDVGETTILSAVVSPDNVSDRTVSWRSSDTAVATVDTNGKVTGVSVGTVIIYASSGDGQIIDIPHTMTVVRHPDGVVLDRSELYLEQNESYTLQAIVFPSDTSDKTLNWRSSNTGVAIVDQNGFVQCVGVGTAIITAETNDGEKTAECFVYGVIRSESLVISGANQVDVGESAILNAQAFPANTTIPDVIWRSGNEDIAVVNENGVVTGISGGNVTIYISTRDGGVTDFPYHIQVIRHPDRVTLDRSELSLWISESYSLSATVLPLDTTDKSLIWKSNNTAVATVDQNGFVQCVGFGTAIITAKTNDGEKSASCTVYGSVRSESVIISGANQVDVGKSILLSAQVFPANTTIPDVIWRSGDESIASVDQNGKVTGVSGGNVIIYISTLDGGITDHPYSIQVIRHPGGISLNHSQINIRLGETTTLTAAVTPSDTTDKSVVWYSSAPEIATVDQTGKVTPVRRGIAIIKAVTNDGSLEASCEVTVIQPVTGIVIPDNNISLGVGQKRIIIATVLPADANNQNVLWSVNNSCVEIDANGLVTALSAGSAIVTAKTIDGNFMAHCLITVYGLRSISVGTMPDKVEYLEGEPLDINGLVIIAEFKDSSHAIITDYQVSGYSSTPGTKTITITYQGKTATFTVTVNAKSLTGITVSPKPDKLIYLEGDSLDLTGMVVTANYNNGTSAPVMDYQVSGYSSTPGTKTITITYQGKTATFTVTVNEKSLQSIAISKNPDKLTYIEQTDLDTSGMELTLIYNNGTTAVITTGWVEEYDFSSAGQKQVTITYQGKTTVLTVTVNAKSLTGIAVTKTPNKTAYLEGDAALDLTGMIVTVSYNNGTSAPITGYQVTGYSSTPGTKTVTVTYQSKTVTFTVTVAAKSVTSISLKSSPAKQTYFTGEDLNLSGAVITVQYNNSTQQDISVTTAMVSGYNANNIGTQTLTVTYSGKSATFTVTVKSAVPSAITSGTFTVSGGQISKISAGLTISALLNGIPEKNYVKVYKGAQEVSGNTPVGTGMTVKLLDGSTLKQTITAIVTGDTDGDGRISINDLVKIQSHLLGKSLTGAYATAANVDTDSRVSINDLVKLQSHLLGKEQIKARSY